MMISNSYNTQRNQSAEKIFFLIFINILYIFSWFCLYNLSLFLVDDYLLATLFFPMGLHIGTLLILPKLYWKSLLSAHLILLSCLILLMLQGIHQPEFLDIKSIVFFYLSPIISTLLCIYTRKYWIKWPEYWQQLLQILSVILIFSFIITPLCFLFFHNTLFAWNTFLTTTTGGVIIAPFLYLLFDFLFKNRWRPVLPTIIKEKYHINIPNLLLIFFFFILSCSSLTSFIKIWPILFYLIIVLPNIFLAYLYGWQGGVFATVINSLLLTSTQYILGMFHSATEVQLFLLTQALIGLGLGIAISRQYQLAQQLQKTNKRLMHELNANKKLTRQLVDVEENIRKEIARELHDEIGQNITAIQIQTMLIKKTSHEENTHKFSDSINELAQKIHKVTRTLLTQLRPHALDTLGLTESLDRLIESLKFKEQNIQVTSLIHLTPQSCNDVTQITLYRISQELLNNTAKYAHASKINLLIEVKKNIQLTYRDNGIGLPLDWKTRGHGLLGIQERVAALGGKLTVNIHCKGVFIIIKLPKYTLS